MKLGIAINSIFNFQLTYNIFNNLNFLSNDSNLDVYLFREIISPFPMPSNFSIMNMREMWSLDGTVIASDLYSLDRLLECPKPKRKLLYVWNLEWIYDGSPNLTKLAKYYLNPEVDLIARSQSHYDVITSAWKRPIGIAEDFNHEQIRKFI